MLVLDRIPGTSKFVGDMPKLVFKLRFDTHLNTHLTNPLSHRSGKMALHLLLINQACIGRCIH